MLRRANKRRVWPALCRATRRVVAYAVGDRSGATCRKPRGRIPAAYCRAHCLSDFWEAYRPVIPAEQHAPAGKQSGERAHVERWDNTLRQRLGRFARKALPCSKSEAMHGMSLRLFSHSYHLACVSRG